MDPALKWPGGKRKLLPLYERHLPPPGEAYTFLEPMCGAAAAALAWRNRWDGRTFIADAQPDLMVFYRELTVALPEVVHHAEELIEAYNTAGQADADARKALYYEWRDTLNAKQVHPARLAALFWAINRTCFNGLPRYNSKGQMNTPWGQHKKIDPKLLRRLADLGDALQGDVFSLGAQDFRETLKICDPKRLVVFFDPPYHNAWDAYTKDGFNWDMQVALAESAEDLLSRGGLPYVCNADTPAIRELYRGVLVPVELRVPRPINSDGYGRGPVGELFFVPPGRQGV